MEQNEGEVMGLFGRKKNKIDEIFEQDKKNQEGERTTENLKAEAETGAVAGAEVAGDKATAKAGNKASAKAGQQEVADKQPAENTESADEEKKSKNPPPFTVGVQKLFKVEDSDDLVVLGNVKGEIEKGSALYITNPGVDGEKSVTISIVEELKVIEYEGDSPKNVTVDKAKDTFVTIRVADGMKIPFRVGTVMFSHEAMTKDIHNAYLDALQDYYVIRNDMKISDEEFERMTVTDLAESWAIYQQYHFRVKRPANQEEVAGLRANIQKFAGMEAKKLLEADHIYCVYSKATGKPYLFSQTVKREKDYMAAPPEILVYTECYQPILGKAYNNDHFETRRIDNGEDKKGIFNFFGTAFYIYGAEGVQVCTNQVAVVKEFLVQKPSTEGMRPVDIPVTNPDLVRWMLLLGQLGKPETEDQKIIFNLYCRFMERELPKARFLIPMNTDEETKNALKESVDPATGKTEVKADSKFKIATMKGKQDRDAVRLYTDWNTLYENFDKTWSGMVQNIDGMIEIFDCAINVGDHPQAGIYVDKNMFEEMKARNSKSANK